MWEWFQIQLGLKHFVKLSKTQPNGVVQSMRIVFTSQYSMINKVYAFVGGFVKDGWVVTESTVTSQEIKASGR